MQRYFSKIIFLNLIALVMAVTSVQAMPDCAKGVPHILRSFMYLDKQKYLNVLEDKFDGISGDKDFINPAVLQEHIFRSGAGQEILKTRSALLKYDENMDSNVTSRELMRLLREKLTGRPHIIAIYGKTRLYEEKVVQRNYDKFMKLDADRNGVISYAEMAAAIPLNERGEERFQIKIKNEQQLYYEMIPDGEEVLTREYLLSTAEKYYDGLDKDGNGRLEGDERPCHSL